MKTENKVIYDRIVINNDTGEIVEEETIRKRGAEPPFVKLYLDCLFSFKGLSKSLNPILLEFLKYMNYANISENNGGQIIFSNAALKQQIAKDTGKTLKRVEQALTEFVKSGIFSRIATGTYQVNANLFGRGDWKDIQNIRAKFDFGNGLIETEFIKNEQPNKQEGENV